MFTWLLHQPMIFSHSAGGTVIDGSPPLGNEGVTTRVIRDEAGWDAIRPDWNELHDASHQASPPLHFDWLRHWWRIYGSAYGPGGLRIVTVCRDHRCIGAIPLYLGRRAVGPLGVRELRVISTGEAEHEETSPDYLNLLCRPGDEAVCSEAVWNELARLPWDDLEFPNLPEDSPLLRGPTADSGPFRTEVVRRGACPVADLSHGFEDYLKGLSPKTRKNSRHDLRAADRNGAVFELATAANTDPFFDDLVRLHQERWSTEGKPGCFGAERFTEFHRCLARDWVPAGRAVLARLSHAGQAYGVVYGFIARNKFDGYQLGVKRTEAGPFDSPGTTANLMLMRALAERGVGEVPTSCAVRLRIRNGWQPMRVHSSRSERRGRPCVRRSAVWFGWEDRSPAGAGARGAKTTHEANVMTPLWSRGTRSLPPRTEELTPCRRVAQCSLLQPRKLAMSTPASASTPTSA